MAVRPIRCLNLTGDRIKEKTVISNLNVPMKNVFPHSVSELTSSQGDFVSSSGLKEKNGQGKKNK